MLQRFRNLRITVKSTIILSLITIVFLSVLFVIIYEYAHENLKQSICLNQKVTVDSVASHIDDQLSVSKKYLKYMSGHLQDTQIFSHKKAQEMFLHHKEAFLTFDAGMLLLSSSGKIVAEMPYNKERIGLDRSQREYFKQVVQTGKTFVSRPYKLSFGSQQDVIAIAVPITDQSGRLSGVLAGRISLSNVALFHNDTKYKIGKTGYFYIIDRQRTLLMHPLKNRVLTTVTPGKNKAVDDALAGKEGSLENTNSQGVVGLTTIQCLKEAPWCIAAHYPLKEAYIGLYSARNKFVLVLLLATVFSVIAVWLSMHPVIGPLLLLTRHMKNLDQKQGNDRYLPVSSTDEVGQLTIVFNSLLQELDDDVLAQKESAEIYQVITDFTNEVATWRLENGDINYISPNCEKILGYQDAEFYADPHLFNNLIHPEDRYLWIDHKPGFCGMDGLGLIYRMICKDDSIRFFRHYCKQVVDAEGNLNGVRGSYTDITIQQQMETTMRKLSQAVEQSSSIIVITDPEGTIEYVNPRFYETTGYTAEEALGQNPRILKSGTMSSDSYADLWRTIKDGKEWRGEFQNKRKDGSIYWESASISPLKDQAGSIIGFLAVKDDITEQKEANQNFANLFTQVEFAKQEWEDTLDHLHDFIILTDANHHIKRYNRILADMSGRDLHQLAGRDWRDLLKEIGFTFITFNATNGELFHNRSARTYDISVYPVHGEEGVRGFVISLNDTTELRVVTQELETALAELNSAQSQIYQQEKLASIGQLAAGVAHEINNPMGFITSNLGSLDKYVSRLSEYIGLIDQTMQQCNSTELTGPIQEARKRLKVERILDDAHQLIAECQDGSARVRRIVQDLKSFSRVDQAETAFMDLNEALETTINIAWNEIKYVATMKRELGDIPKIKCFPQQLNQVFLNLLVNAAHALGETSGEITVHTEQDGDSVLVKISDTGCGMTEEVQRRIFEPFFTTKEVGKGTGLGLSISYDIIKKHGGTITVESEVGKGTTFTVKLPIEAALKDQEMAI